MDIQAQPLQSLSSSWKLDREAAARKEAVSWMPVMGGNKGNREPSNVDSHSRKEYSHGVILVDEIQGNRSLPGYPSHTT
jgi:hypothetical protein